MEKATVGALWAEAAAGKEMEEKSVSLGASAGSGNSKNSSNGLHKFPAWNSSPSLIFTHDSIFNCHSFGFQKVHPLNQGEIAFYRFCWPARPKERQFASILTFLFFSPRALAWACGLAPSFWSLLQFSVTFSVWSVFLHTGLICLLERAGLFPRYHCPGLC